MYCSAVARASHTCITVIHHIVLRASQYNVFNCSALACAPQFNLILHDSSTCSASYNDVAIHVFEFDAPIIVNIINALQRIGARISYMY